MRKNIILLLVISINFFACKNAYEKEIGEIEGLITIINETEKSLLSVDTSRVFTAKRQMELDLREFHSSKDTLSKEEAFKVADIFGNKKKLYRLTSNYPDYINQINFSKNQLISLKKDLENGLISKEEFASYYATEQAAVMDLNNQINKAINGLDVVLDKLRLDRPELLEMIEQRKLNSAEHE